MNPTQVAITITQDEQGRQGLQVQSNEENPYALLGILDVARDFILSSAFKAPPEPEQRIAMPGRDLVRRMRNGTH